jgi:Tfp pilus assembly protein PilO
MQNQRIKNKIYINLLLVLVIGFIVYFLIFPQYSGKGTFYSPEKNISSLLKSKADSDSAILIANTYNTKLSKINSDYNNALERLPVDTLNKILPSSLDPVIIIHQLTKIAALPGSNMLLIDPKFSDDGSGSSSQNSNKKYNTLSVTFNVQGTYESIKFFLKNLENSDRIFNVTKLNFSSPQDAKVNSILKYTISVETYYLK